MVPSFILKMSPKMEPRFLFVRPSGCMVSRAKMHPKVLTQLHVRSELTLKCNVRPVRKASESQLKYQESRTLLKRWSSRRM